MASLIMFNFVFCVKDCLCRQVKFSPFPASSMVDGKRFDNSFFPDVRLKAALVRFADFACVFFVCIFANDLDMFSYDQKLQPVLVQHSQFTLFITVLENSLLA